MLEDKDILGKVAKNHILKMKEEIKKNYDKN